MTTPFHYRACGLDEIYLINGFTIEETPYGRSVAIHDADALHAVIARHVVLGAARLRGQEVRFLRAMLDLSQRGLGRLLEVTRDAVAKWESEPCKGIPGPADRALRLIYALRSGDQALATEICAGLGKGGPARHGDNVFEDSDDGWFKRAA
jgi:putative transcriptional regulator